MDRTLPCSITKERQHFIKQLTTNPYFFIRHIPALFSMAVKRYRRKHNRKMHPPYLPRVLPRIPITNETVTWQAIPERTWHPLQTTPINSPTMQISTDDHEDYLHAHRFGELITLLIASHDEQTRHTMPDKIYHWITKPPPKTDPAWETYSTCERVANLLTWISFIPKEKRSAFVPHEIVSFISDSLYWIADHLEYYGKETNNHILNNARALILCGVALHHPAAIKQGMAILQHCLPILIQAQGCLRERSTHYQLIVLTWLLDAYSFIGSHNQILMRMRDVAAAFCNEEGQISTLIGDISPDASPEESALRLKLCYPDIWPKRKTSKVTTSPIPTMQKYDDFYMIEHEKQRILVNCPAQLPTYPTHSHNDLSSFVWFYADLPILIDSGRARYDKTAIANHQKSAFGHNLIFINQFPPCAESMVIQGNWWPKPYANISASVMLYPENSLLTITHNGFKRATPVVEHRRHIRLKQNELQIDEELKGENESDGETVNVMICWHWHESFRLVQPGVLANDKIRIEVETDAEEMELISSGWSSSQYGAVKHHPILILSWRVHLPFIASTRFKVTSLCAA